MKDVIVDRNRLPGGTIGETDGPLAVVVGGGIAGGVGSRIDCRDDGCSWGMGMDARAEF